MQVDDSRLQKILAKDFPNAIIRIGLVVFLIIMCVRVFAPFTNLMLWGLILAIALYPLHQCLARWLGGRQASAAVLLVLGCLLLLGVPTVMLGGSFAGQIHDTYTSFDNNSITIKPPVSAVADWPIVGKQVYSLWNDAATNLPGLIERNHEQLQALSKRVLAAAANTAGSVLLFLAALLVAGIIMVYGDSGEKAMQRISIRMVGPDRGPRLQKLTVATVRSVATGVIGVAFIQALLLGLGFLVAGIPAAGVLAVFVMLFGIMQLPASIISLPVIIYLWWSGDTSTTINILYTIYFILAGMVDNILKPLLLGRGVDAPMPVVLLGALGGMATGGIIGMFVGAVLLSIGYQIFMEWVNDEGVNSSGYETGESGELSTEEQP
jgi:predicted PurR-regulated permease PerM